ncbi:Prokaryotic ubiquitin-like protein Pup [hydrothermal vent metagenome]|uniref:Prokaryotic ubiquitin-like protein Pup n=1 Tax=hydrothermal vent metagenome TaxID=652676 RepID=A0A3B0T1L4_9ZZZZ
MTDREHQQKKQSDGAETQDDVQPAAQGQEVTDQIDDLLEEIDSVLEENAEEFVKNYVQKGGE